MFKQTQKGAFSTFDPRTGTGNNFDPRVGNKWNGADGSGQAGSEVGMALPGQKMQINITLNNPTLVTLTFEMFNYLNSFLRARNATYATGNYQYIPMLSSQGILALTALTDGTVGFDQDGNLQIRGDGSPADAIATIGCTEVSYAGLFESSGITAFQVAFFRFTCNTDAQIDQPIKWFRQTMAGGIEQNNISPRAYFRPNQFQPTTIDITVSFTIGIDSGLSTKLFAGESVRLSLFINAWTDQSIGQ